jgi:alkylation response protein AidB-like acyl-CoA dehydrogenase
MDFELTERQLMIREAAHRFAMKEIEPLVSGMDGKS